MCLIVEAKAKSQLIAAKLLKKERTYIHRLFSSVNEYLGLDNSWTRKSAGIEFPPEIKRFVNKIREMEYLFWEAEKFPRITAGSMASIITMEVCIDVILQEERDWFVMYSQL